MRNLSGKSEIYLGSNRKFLGPDSRPTQISKRIDAAGLKHGKTPTKPIITCKSIHHMAVHTISID